MSFTLADNKALCKERVETIKKQGQNKKLGILLINGVRVLEGKKINRNRLPITALL
jgi:hypothetical protein